MHLISADTPQTEAPTQPSLSRVLGVRDGIAIVVGTVIGSGIFLVPGPIAQQLPTLTLALSVWLAGGLLSLFGSLSLGELAAAYPGAGGLYVYLRQAYGRPVAFLYGCALFSLIQSGSIATLGSGFSLYVSKLIPLTPLACKIIPIACILLFSLINLFGMRLARLVQNLGTISKVAGLALVFGLLISRGRPSLLRLKVPHAPLPALLLGFGTALTAVLRAYEGWHVVSFTASEFRTPSRDLPRSLVWGTLIVTAVYLLLNVAYYSVLSSAQIAAGSSTAAVAMKTAWGEGALLLVSAVVLTSILGATNGMIMTAPRVYYAMARDGVFFAKFGEIGRKFHVPVFAILMQAIWASALTLMGSFQQLFTYVVFTAWVFYGLTVAAVIVLRPREPLRERKFLTPGYPWTPAAFVVAAAGVAVSTIIASPIHAAFGIALILVGAPLYLAFRAKQKGLR